MLWVPGDGMKITAHCIEMEPMEFHVLGPGGGQWTHIPAKPVNSIVFRSRRKGETFFAGKFSYFWLIVFVFVLFNP